jgi:hypothetical protein
VSTSSETYEEVFVTNILEEVKNQIGIAPKSVTYIAGRKLNTGSVYFPGFGTYIYAFIYDPWNMSYNENYDCPIGTYLTSGTTGCSYCDPGCGD